MAVKEDVKEKPESADLMDKIRNYVLGHHGLGATDYKEAEMAMNVDPSTGTAKGYAEGGDVQAPPEESAIFNQAAQEPAADIEEDQKVADSHPATALPDYLQGQEKKIDQWGPDAQAAVMDSIRKEQTSLPTTLGRIGSGFADAVMQAGGGTPQYEKEFDENLLNREKMQAETIPQLQGMTMKGIEAKNSLEQMNPTSPLGSANMPMLEAAGKMYGMTPDMIQAMKNSNPQTAIKLLEGISQFAAGQQKLQIEQEMKMLELKIQESNAKATQDIARMGRQTEEKRVNLEGLKEASAHPFLHPIQAYKASRELANQAEGTSQAAPYGQEVVRNGKTYEWSSATGKYHLK